MELPDIIKTIFNSIIDLGGVFYCGGVLTMVDSPYCLKKVDYIVCWWFLYIMGSGGELSNLQ